MLIIPFLSMHYSNYFVGIGDPTVHLTTVLIGSVFFEGLKMTQYESKHVAHVSMVIDIPINCRVRLTFSTIILLRKYNMLIRVPLSAYVFMQPRQHTTLTKDRHPCLRWDSNPQWGSLL